MLMDRSLNICAEQRRTMGREVQRIGLGFVRVKQSRRIVAPAPRRWLGRRLERFGRRLQSHGANVLAAPSHK